MTYKTTRYTPQTLEYIRGVHFDHFRNSRVVAVISGIPITVTDSFVASMIAGNNTFVVGNPSTGKSQLISDITHEVVGEENASKYEKNCTRRPEGHLRFIDRSAYVETGRSDEAVKMKI